MELIQYKGPFRNGSYLTVPAAMGYSYVHIGIQIPKPRLSSVPETVVSNNNKTTTFTGNYRAIYGRPQVEINDITYQINENGILEFDGLSEIDWRIYFLDDLPAETIIDIVRRG